MPHGLTAADTMFSVRTPPWHGLGAVLEKPPESIEEALVVSGLSWDVVQVPVLYPVAKDMQAPEGRNEVVADGVTYVEVPDTPFALERSEFGIMLDPNPGLRDVRMNVRSDTWEPLGIVSRQYRVVQNREAFAFLADLIGSEVHFETAGGLYGGRRVWVLVKIPDWVEVGGDPVETYILVETSHDTSRAVSGYVTPVRVVCSNTLLAAVDQAKRSFSVKHFGDPTTALHDARRALEVTVDYTRQFKEMGDRLASEKVTARMLKKYLEELLPVEEEWSARAKLAQNGSRDHITEMFKRGPTVGNAPGTKWSLINCIVEHEDFYGGSPGRESELRPRESEEQRMSVFRRSVDDSAGMKAQAWKLITA